MDQTLQREWYDLQSRTWQLLRTRDHILRSKFSPLFQYLVKPSFTDTWCIDFVRTGGNLAAYYTIWRMTEDVNVFTTASERLKHPKPYVPTLESTRMHDDTLSIALLLKRLEQIQIPLLGTKNAISVDGVSFEMQIGDGLTGVLLQWHNELPEEWSSELADVVFELNDMRNRHVTRASEQSDAVEP